MQLPIYLYGQPVLRKETEEIDADYPELQALIKNMYETLVKADGVGLAAPQIGLDIRLFVIDLNPLADEEPAFKGYTKTFINPEIIDFSDDKVTMEEGCLSLPGIHENVSRSRKIRMIYQDEHFEEHEEEFEDYVARVIQHEYDHLEGHVFTDRIHPIRRQLVKGKLNAILKGQAYCSYRVKPQR